MTDLAPFRIPLLPFPPKLGGGWVFLLLTLRDEYYMIRGDGTLEQ